MMRSMYSGVSGLRSHQTKMDVIGNNISNVNTIGFKTQRVTFADTFSQTTQSATAANDDTGLGGRNAMQIGLGANVSSIDMLMTQGASQRTDNPFDLMIQGDGFMVVSDASGEYYTRAGAIRLDADGNLTMANGMIVQGWPANNSGTNIIKGQVEGLSVGNSATSKTPPEATTSIDILGNLNIADATSDTDGDGIPDGITTQLQFFDSQGTRYSMEIVFQYVENDNVAGQLGITAPLPATNPYWTVMIPTKPVTIGQAVEQHLVVVDATGREIALPSAVNNNAPGVQGVGANGELFTSVQMVFDSNGQIVSPATGAGGDGVATSIFTWGTVLDLSTAIDPDTGVPLNLKATLGDLDPATPGAGGAIEINMNQMTQYDARATIKPLMADGKPAGNMTGYTIGTDGKIVAYYDNGDQMFLGQVSIAKFDNPAGLEKFGSNLFISTQNSGVFDGIGEMGSFQTGVLEMSNVDLSQEFTEMIVTQRGFQANAKIITASDEILQELVNLKR
ncbi:hypothetical protein AN639_09005 [Candidatus Epulonipiscium fishelsonii]|uniref:Uncharacterized protein n=1 Tax=Candidatus Epulonipiscium fishelsonii TaxID=77094 RepID=A0ACC8XDW2_9FIRM|nr:hypothetical protein AN639_09005 [Epulopiscium sp. SCG-B05WGA-EpuloA1]ONI40984.1 hypothetical protein AN396_04290 [Epulopiscium sp. SCG-B11WGA-EpuloA1]ONI47336.1 hypothetical protein AN644_00735 [Epulopiscium sp. SCG-C06WGA-EpuloA1]